MSAGECMHKNNRIHMPGEALADRLESPMLCGFVERDRASSRGKAEKKEVRGNIHSDSLVSTTNRTYLYRQSFAWPSERFR
jgi:hypothetical protein